MTTQQMKWAMQHDWFVTAWQAQDSTGWVVCVRPSFEGDRETMHTDYTALRNWAGY